MSDVNETGPEATFIPTNPTVPEPGSPAEAALKDTEKMEADNKAAAEKDDSVQGDPVVPGEPWTGQ